MINKSKYQGYTLIGLLFIIVVIGIIATIGMNAFKERSGNIKTDQTMLQIQQFLQAASAYYFDNQCWPTSPTCKTQPAPPFDTTNYIPIIGNSATLKNPWGGLYTFTLNQDTQQFLIQTNNVPRTYAQRIASQLPNVAVSDCGIQTCTLTATAFSPLISSLASANAVHNPPYYDFTGLNTLSFTCPQGWTPQTQIFLSGFIAGTGSQIDAWCIYTSGLGVYITQGVYGSLPSCFGTRVNAYACNYYALAKTIRSKGQGLDCKYPQESLGYTALAYITYCVNPNSPLASQPKPQL